MALKKRSHSSPAKEANVPVAPCPSEQPDVRKAIVDFIVWNQAMEGIPSSQERAEAAYDEALRNRHRVFER
jgi:hypothetical protein